MQQRTTAVLASIIGMSVLGGLLYFELSPGRDAVDEPAVGLALDSPPKERDPAPAASGKPLSGATATRGQGENEDSLLDRLEAGDPDLLEKYGFGQRELALSKIDLDVLREKMPDNLFWEMSAPTTDDLVKAQRRETRELWREQKNRISANLAGEYAIRDYYAQQNALSEDYVAITGELLDNYSDVLADRDYQLLLMANRLHSARLQEIPAQLATALERRGEFLAHRERWREDPAAYEEALRIEREAALQELAARSGGGAPASH